MLKVGVILACVNAGYIIITIRIKIYRQTLHYLHTNFTNFIL